MRLPVLCDFAGAPNSLTTAIQLLFFTQQNIKDLLMGFVNSVVLVLQKRLSSQREQIWDSILVSGISCFFGQAECLPGEIMGFWDNGPRGISSIGQEMRA